MRVTRIAVIALLGIVTMFTVACSSSSNHTSTPPLTPGFVTHTDSGYSISVPNSWEIQPMEATVIWAFFTCPSRCAGIATTVSVIETATNALNVQSYYSVHVEPRFKNVNEYDFISKEDLTIDGIPAVKVIYTDIHDVNNVGAIQIMDCYLMNGQTLWSIEGSCAPSCWDTYKDTFNTMASSFHLL